MHYIYMCVHLFLVDQFLPLTGFSLFVQQSLLWIYTLTTLNITTQSFYLKTLVFCCLCYFLWILYHVFIQQTKVTQKAPLPMRYIRGEVGKLNKSIMLVGFLLLSHGFVLLESNFHNYDEPMNGELVMLRSQGIPFILTWLGQGFSQVGTNQKLSNSISRLFQEFIQISWFYKPPICTFVHTCWKMSHH